MIEINGSYGEGGGQVLRTSLALSLITGKPFRICRIRAKRKKPGLMRQHLTAVQAAAEIGNANTKGLVTGSQTLEFTPGHISPGAYRFSVGTAGSATLVLQTILPALLTGRKPSELILEGGTHNPYAPPYDFIERAFLPVIGKMGPVFDTQLDRPGFYPAGGGQFRIKISPAETLSPVTIEERGSLIAITAESLISKIKTQVADRELVAAGDYLGIGQENLKKVIVRNSTGPGNTLLIMMKSEHITEVVTGFGQKGVKAETLTLRAAHIAKRYLESGATMGKHLADQLLIPFALAGKGTFTTCEITEHTRTNSDIIRKFLDVDFQIEKKSSDLYRISIHT